MIKGLGERLRERREQYHLSQKQAAEQLKISYSVLCNYENGERTPSLNRLIQLARFYQCSTDYLLGFSKERNDKTLDASMLTDKQVHLLSTFLSGLKE